MFQSTPSVRRATLSTMRLKASLTRFNPRPPYGERQFEYAMSDVLELFQSTPSVRRATNICQKIVPNYFVSIHALHTESDSMLHSRYRTPGRFNPRPPHGERLYDGRGSRVCSEFQSTPSTRRATTHELVDGLFFDSFNPRPPHGERQGKSSLQWILGFVSIHALHTESDCTHFYPLPRKAFKGQKCEARN